MNIAQLLNISDPRSNICLIICILQTKTSDYPSTPSRHLMIIQLFLEWKRTMMSILMRCKYVELLSAHIIMIDHDSFDI